MNTASTQGPSAVHVLKPNGNNTGGHDGRWANVSYEGYKGRWTNVTGEHFNFFNNSRHGHPEGSNKEGSDDKGHATGKPVKPTGGK